MNSENIDNRPPAELQEVVEIQVAGIVAAANEQGFSSKEMLAACPICRSQHRGFGAGPDPAENAGELPAGPHSAPDLVDQEKTPGSGALPEPGAVEIDPGVG